MEPRLLIVIILLIAPGVVLSQEQNTTRNDSSRPSSNYSRLMFAPSGRPLTGGEGFFSDLNIFFPGVSYAFTDNISVMGGSFVWFDTEELGKLNYVAPMIGYEFSDTFAMCGGTLYISQETYRAGIAFTTASFGPKGRQFSCGFGWGYEKDRGESDYKFSEYPILIIGGIIDIDGNNSLVLENWMFTQELDIPLKQPYAFVLRSNFGKSTLDFGAIIVAKINNNSDVFNPWGSVMPWVNYIYNFKLR